MKTAATSRVLLYALFNRKQMILTLGLGIFGTIVLGTWLWPPRYEASSSLIIRGGLDQNHIFPAANSSGQATLFVKQEEEINSEIEIIRSRPVLERVTEALSLHQHREIAVSGLRGVVHDLFRGVVRPVRAAVSHLLGSTTADPEQLLNAGVARLQEELWVEPASDSQIVRVTYRDRDPGTAADVVNRVVEEYLKQRLAIHLNRSESGFYAEQISTAEAELEALRNQLGALKGREGIVSFTEQAHAFVKKIEGFDVALATVQKEIISVRSKVDRVRNLLKTDPDLLIPLPEIAKNPLIEQMEHSLVNQRLQLESLRQRYTEDSRQVATALEQIEEQNLKIREQVQRFLDREVADLEKLQAEEQALSRTIERLKKRLTALPEKEMTIAALEKRVTDQDEALSAMRKRYQDSLVSQATDHRLQNAKIVSRAAVPIDPVVPNLILNLSLGFLLAIMVSVSAALFTEYLDDSLKMPEDIEHYLGRQAFASIPEL